jgi:hypothetical protein
MVGRGRAVRAEHAENAGAPWPRDHRNPHALIVQHPSDSGSSPALAVGPHSSKESWNSSHNLAKKAVLAPETVSGMAYRHT